MALEPISADQSGINTAILKMAKSSGISSPSLKRYLRRGAVSVAFLGIAMILALAGCHSAYINATVVNRTAAPISLVQVEYPSASFGIQAIAPAADFHYRFKVLGSGPVKITYTDTAGHEEKSTGPTLNEGAEGSLDITVASDGVQWQSPPSAK